MILRKKTMLILSIFLTSTSFVHADPFDLDSNKDEKAAEIAEMEKLGNERIADILKTGQHGIDDYNKKIKFAQVKNLSTDLNLKELAQAIGCKTAVGKSFLLDAINKPANSQDTNKTIERRKAAISMLVQNPELRSKVDALVAQAGKEEQSVAQLMETIKKTTPVAYPYCWMFVSKNLKFLGLPAIAIKIYSKAISVISGKKFDLKISGIDDLCRKYKGIRAKTFKSLVEVKPLTEMSRIECFIDGVYNLISFQDYACSLYGDHNDGLHKRQLVHSLANMVKISEDLEKLCKKNDIDAQFAASLIQDKDGKDLIKNIKHARYRNKHESLPVVTSFVHAFMSKLYKNEKKLAPIFASIAEMDAYSALAGKMVAGEKTDNKVCFVTFEDGDKPGIRAKASWNLLVKNAVANDMHASKNILLNGPNAGGKSTAIKSILQNIVLGQSFGVAAAKKFNYSKFDVIHSYLNVSDDILNGLSLFASEVKRAQEILAQVTSLKPGQKFFFALDELFTGTGAEHGADIAVGFVKKIAAFLNTQFIYATHFGKMKEVGESDTSNCTNYKVDAPTQDAQGKLIYPFTISPGTSNFNIARIMAEQAGII